MSLIVKRLTDTARLPIRATEGSAGYDLCADESLEIGGYAQAWISTGIAVAIAPGFCGQVWPRSGLAGKGVTRDAGLIDSDYRGDVRVLLVNRRGASIDIRRGDRIAQLVIVPVATPTVVEADALPTSERGENGFGSTGT